MANSPAARVLILSLLAIASPILSPGAVNADGRDHHLGWAAAPNDGGGMEFGMESEMSRRVLATSQYISYGPLQSDRVPCTLKDVPYSDCNPGATANPYSRGCSSIADRRS